MISFSKNNRKRCGILPRIKRGFDEIRKLSKTCFGAYYIKRVFKCPFEMDKKRLPIISYTSICFLCD